MSLIENIIRPDVRAIDPYHVPNSAGFLKLDAMENPYQLPADLQTQLGQHLAKVALNRYPIPSYTALRTKICERMHIPAGYDIVIGNGSDELIALLSIACATRDKPTKVLAPVPCFVMYALSAQFAGMEFIGIPLQSDFSLDMKAMLSTIAEQKPSIVYLAYPNNPTGNLFNPDDMVKIIRAMDGIGIVVSDEAYQPFAQTSFMSRLPEHPNLVVMRTVSKMGLAGVRLGYMSAAKELLTEFDKVRPPYNVNVLTEAAVSFALDHLDVFDQQAATLRQERKKLTIALENIPDIAVFPSSANFLLFRIQNADKIFEKLMQRNVLIKNVGKMHTLLKDCLRVNVSTPEENKLFLEQLRACIQ